MKKIYFMLSMLLLCMGCQKKDDTQLLETFIEDFYQVSVSEIESYTEYITQQQTISMKDLPQWIHVMVSMTDRYKEQYLKERNYIPIIDFQSNNAVDHIDFISHAFEVDFEDDDYTYYLHTSSVEIHYQDGTTSKDDIAGRIGVDKHEHLIHNYKISDPIEMKL